MRLKTQFLVGVLLVTVVSATFSQGTFRNLNFDEANYVNPPAPVTATYVPFTTAFPGWAGYVGTNQADLAMINGGSAGGALMTLITPNSAPGLFNWSNLVISPTFTAVLAAGQWTGGLSPVTLAQTGVVPPNAQSLRFSLGSYSWVSDFSVSFNGQELPFFVLSAGTNFAVYGASISMFAGAAGELRFTESPISWPFAKAILDDIHFSNQPIPEPTTVGLFALGAFLLGWRFLKRKS